MSVIPWLVLFYGIYKLLKWIGVRIQQYNFEQQYLYELGQYLRKTGWKPE
jgi:hypothetical protein